MTWTKITPDNLPTDADNDKLYLFAAFDEDHIIISCCMTWDGLKDNKEYSIKHRYTHYMEVVRPKN